MRSTGAALIGLAITATVAVTGCGGGRVAVTAAEASSIASTQATRSSAQAPEPAIDLAGTVWEIEFLEEDGDWNSADYLRFEADGSVAALDYNLQPDPRTESVLTAWILVGNNITITVPSFAVYTGQVTGNTMAGDANIEGDPGNPYQWRATLLP